MSDNLTRQVQCALLIAHGVSAGTRSFSDLESYMKRMPVDEERLALQVICTMSNDRELAQKIYDRRAPHVNKG